MRTAFARGLAVVSFCALSAGVAAAQCDVEYVRFPSQLDQRSGWALAAEGDWLVVGAPRFDAVGGTADERGTARVYRRTGLDWELEQQLVLGSNPQNARIGSSLDMTSDVLIAGAPRDLVSGASVGSAYVALRVGDQWVLDDRLTPTGGLAGIGFGTSVAVWGDFALVGAPGDDVLGPDAGAAFLFQRVGGTWMQIDEWRAGDGAAGDGFGISVDLRDGAAVIGAPGHDGSGSDAGAAYVFEESGGSWSQVGKLDPTDAIAGARLGTAVAIAARLGTARLAFVGAPHATSGGPDAGAVYTFIGFVNMAWGGFESQKLGSAQPGAELGASVEVDAAATRAVFGAPGNAPPEPSAYVFEPVGNPWIENVRLRHAASVAGDRAGTSVALSGELAFVGAPRADTPIMDSGAAFAFGIPQVLDSSPDCDANGTVDVCDIAGGTPDVDGNLVLDECEELGVRFCAAVANSTGQVGRMTVLGSSAVLDDRLDLWASRLPASSNIGYFIMGTGQNASVPAGSAGPLCVAPGIQRYLPPVQDTNDLGGGFMRAVGTSGPVSGNITAGSTWNFQAWHRDSAAGTSNLTDAVSVVFQ